MNLTSAISYALCVDNKLISEAPLTKTLTSKSPMKEHEIFNQILGVYPTE
jgi:hypothetical protein